ncbi:hypothetical protein CEUSTIGMA_g12836.t1 [Chlamydomonas eustigma]|uniref:Uncharacterized protein n=1 Tax=Chlamydomonas eustigma TaxID=1157962 RepID=A0A250XRI6_9CHLO|nr:hypothetical protein CEUSTIGMA_g12836.t1 [Chlamydomonas eustigma]|eukprot:GAX85420.1 hypothetical protein CEUSTIGMA_g12836.t1 [Chlamydomonas eustigma]
MSFTASEPALEYKQSTFSVPSSLTAASTTTLPSSRGDANNRFVFAAEREALQASPSSTVLPAAAERQALQASPSSTVLPAAAERQALQASPSLAVLPAATAAERSSVYEEVMALTEQLGPRVEGWLREEFEQLFDHIVCRKLPWKNDDILAVLSRHWDTVALRVRSPQETKRLVAGMLEVSKQNIRDRRRSVKGFCLQADELRKAFWLL